MSHVTTWEVKIFEVVDIELGAMVVTTIMVSKSDTWVKRAEHGELVEVVAMGLVSFWGPILELIVVEGETTTWTRGVVHTLMFCLSQRQRYSPCPLEQRHKQYLHDGASKDAL